MSDLISRQKVENRLKEDIKKCKEALEKATHPLSEEKIEQAIYFDELYLECLKNVPTVEERKHGHWIDFQQGRWIYAKCSVCDKISDTRTPYCAYCGSKNEVSEDD